MTATSNPPVYPVEGYSKGMSLWDLYYVEILKLKLQEGDYIDKVCTRAAKLATVALQVRNESVPPMVAELTPVYPTLPEHVDVDFKSMQGHEIGE